MVQTFLLVVFDKPSIIAEFWIVDAKAPFIQQLFQDGISWRNSVNDCMECTRCNVEMEVGFIPDARHSGYWQQKWVRGTFDEKNTFWPFGSIWAALRIESKPMIPVTALRCPKCGHLEFYADGR